MPPRTVAALGALCLLIGWLLASTLAPPVASLQSRPARQVRPAATAVGADVVEPIQLDVPRATAALPPPAPRRNPFFYGREPALPGPARPAAATALSAPDAINALPPAGPRLTLAGIGVSGAQRTAVLADGDRVRVVAVGDAAAGYTVVEITDSSVTLADAGGGRLVLRLR